MNATEARKLTNTTKATVDLEPIMDKIRNACNNGCNKILHFGSLPEEQVKILRKDGYNVTYPAFKQTLIEW